jgi:hypothetical protein
MLNDNLFFSSATSSPKLWTVAALSFPGVKGYFTPLSVVFRNCPLSLDILLPTNECHYDDIRQMI